MPVTEINGIKVRELFDFRERARQDATAADRNPILIAHWVGKSRSRVEFKNTTTFVGGEGELNPMQTLLASLAACDVDLVAMHASFLGLKIERLSVEASGHFNVRSYLGLEDAPGPGYDTITYTVRVHIPGATSEQIAYLRERCERSSPVGDSLARAIPLRFEIQAET